MAGKAFFKLKIVNGKITEEVRTEGTGAEKSKLFPTDIGMVVTDFLISHFPQIMDFNFTAKVEEEFDEIAAGNTLWTKMLEEDAFSWFKENGGLTRVNGQRFRDMILSKGNTEDYNKMFKAFRGHEPSIQSMQREMGLPLN